MKTDISIIVPIYNLEHYLPKCIDSILAQTFTNYELILVNDGSTDKSGELCDEYANLDQRVKVIHKENGGVALARNAGLEAAKGNYIGFVDNDDYINKFMFEKLYNTATTYSSDIVVCNFLNDTDDQHYNTRMPNPDYKTQHFNYIESLNQLYTSNNITFVVPWNKLYRSTLFKDIRYKPGSINDDETVAHQLLYSSRKTTYIHTELYYYVKRKDSQINSPFNIKRLGAVDALKDREVFFRNIKEKDLHQKALRHYMEKFFWYYYLAKSSLKNVDKELKELKRTFDRSLIFILKHKEIGWKQKMMCIIFSVNPPLFEFIKNGQSKKNEKQQSRI